MCVTTVHVYLYKKMKNPNPHFCSSSELGLDAEKLRRDLDRRARLFGRGVQLGEGEPFQKPLRCRCRCRLFALSFFSDRSGPPGVTRGP